MADDVNIILYMVIVSDLKVFPRGKIDTSLKEHPLYAEHHASLYVPLI